MASLLDPKYDYEDPGVSWIHLVMATRILDHAERMDAITHLCIIAKNSHWTHELWDKVVAELERPADLETPPEHEVLDVDSAEDAAADTLQDLGHSFRDEDSQWDQ